MFRALCGRRRGVATAAGISLFSSHSTNSRGLSVMSVSRRLVPSLALVATQVMQLITDRALAAMLRGSAIDLAMGLMTMSLR